MMNINFIPKKQQVDDQLVEGFFARVESSPLESKKDAIEIFVFRMDDYCNDKGWGAFVNNTPDHDHPDVPDDFISDDSLDVLLKIAVNRSFDLNS